MKPKHILPLLTLSLLGGSAMAQTNLPEAPAFWREVTGVRYANPTTNNATPQHYRAHVPAFRTSNDGRVALRILPTVDFTLLMPEKLTAHPLMMPEGLAAANSTVMSATQYYYKDANGNNLSVTNHVSRFSTPTLHPSTGAVVSGSIVHSALYDPFTSQGVSLNPKPLNGEDVYELIVVSVFNFDNGTFYDGDARLFATKVKITVANPKTTSAYIRKMETQPPQAGPIIPDVGGKEPTIVGADGRLIVWRLGNNTRRWRNPNNQLLQDPQSADIVYSYYPSGAPCDVSQWTAENQIPISFAPSDNRINGSNPANTNFGFAMAPFRDPTGAAITPGRDFGGTYPWMDREGKNLFFTSLVDTLYVDKTRTKLTHAARYPIAGVPGEPAIAGGIEAADGTRGICFVGLWSQGKIVQIDNLTNDMDYAVSSEDAANGMHRMVKLFQGPGSTATVANGWLRMGSARVNKTGSMPAMENRNSTIIESVENRFNYNAFAKPPGFRDVMWPLANGKQNDTLDFDEFTDPDVFIYCSMVGLLKWDSTTPINTNRELIYSSGWNASTKTFSSPVALQNGATALASRWAVPTQGDVIGGGRMEPAAVGGVNGKGFWMTGTNGLRFTVPAQPQNVALKPWYVGVFVDSRSADDSTARTLCTFPDGSKIRIQGRSQILYSDMNGTLNRISLPAKLTQPTTSYLDDLLPQKGWAHLGFHIYPGGRQVDFYLNGMLYNRWTDAKSPILQMTQGQLTLGSIGTPEPGFHGWVDEFKVIAHGVDAETACNYAGGTLIGFPASSTSEWNTRFAERFPAWTHAAISETLRNGGEPVFDRYACFYDHRGDHKATRLNIPAGTTSLADSIHFPEGPLYQNAPRPDSVSNQFCIQCHHSAGKAGLDLMALMLDTGTNAHSDLRRQPNQPPRAISGIVPANYFAFGPSAAQSLSTAVLLDAWTMPALPPTRSVQSFTLVSGGKDILTLTDGSVVDPVKLGTSQFAIRANLDTAQGGLQLTIDGSSTSFTGGPFISSESLFAPGIHTVTAAPQSGAAQSITFTVASGTRIIAGLRNDFAAHSPASGWSLEWNAAGAIGDALNHRQLYWSPSLLRYSADGSSTYPCTSTTDNAQLASRAGFFIGTSGACYVSPGRGTAFAGNVTDRFAVATYRVHTTGSYALVNSLVQSTTANGNGGQLRLYKESASGTMTALIAPTLIPASLTQGVTFDMALGTLAAGDILHICIGPNGNDASDEFEIDLNLQVTTP